MGERHKSGRHAVPCGLGKLTHAPPLARTSLVGHALACPFSSRTAPLSLAYRLRSETGHFPRKRMSPPLLCRTPPGIDLSLPAHLNEGSEIALRVMTNDAPLRSRFQ